MWFWQRKSVRKRFLLWAKLLLASAFGHFLFLLCLLFVYHGDSIDLFLVVDAKNSDGAPVVFRTLQSVAQRNFLTGRTAPPKPSQSKAQKIVQQLPAKNNQKAVAANPSKPKPVSKTMLAKNEVKKEPAKKTVNNSADAKKQTPKKQEPIKKVVEKKPAVSEKKITQAAQSKVPAKDATKEAVDPGPEQLVLSNKVELSDEDDMVGIPAYIATFQQHISEQFKPPVGIAPDVQCQIKLTIDWDGALHDVSIEQSSRVLMYDVAARSAVYTLSLPRWTWGKSVTITFRQ